MKLIPQKVLDRKAIFHTFYKKDRKTGCWVWQRSVSNKGYGQFMSTAAHRISYTLRFEDPKELCVLHKCDNPPCVNPDHLFLGTPLDNMRDMKAKGRDHNNPGGWNANYITMTPEKLEEMKCYYLSDTSISTRDVARKFNMEAKHCWCWLKKAGVEIRGRRRKITFSNEDMARFKDMYESGARITDLANIMGVDKNSAAKRLKAYGVKIRDKNDRPTRFYRGEVVQK